MPTPPQSGPWLDWRVLAHDPADNLADDQADAAVTCLYDFLHALGRRDVEAALSHVAEDYHTLEEDREVDRLGLRQQVESLLDSLRGWELAVSLAEAPEALAHPYGILIYTEIQIDAHHPLENLRRSLVDRRLALLRHQGDQGWAIAALSRV